MARGGYTKQYTKRQWHTRTEFQPFVWGCPELCTHTSRSVFQPFWALLERDRTQNKAHAQIGKMGMGELRDAVIWMT
jgi:hypothetical protein